jgi:hypothetical protein
MVRMTKTIRMNLKHPVALKLNHMARSSFLKNLGSATQRSLGYHTLRCLSTSEAGGPGGLEPPLPTFHPYPQLTLGVRDGPHGGRRVAVAPPFTGKEIEKPRCRAVLCGPTTEGETTKAPPVSYLVLVLALSCAVLVNESMAVGTKNDKVFYLVVFLISVFVVNVHLTGVNRIKSTNLARYSNRMLPMWTPPGVGVSFPFYPLRHFSLAPW